MPSRIRITGDIVKPPARRIKTSIKPAGEFSLRKKALKSSAGRKLKVKKRELFSGDKKWQELLKEAESPGFKKAHPVTSIHIKNVKSVAGKIVRKKVKNDKEIKMNKATRRMLKEEKNDAFKIYPLEKKWNAHKLLKEEFDRTKWRKLLKLLLDESFNKEFPVTANFFGIASQSVDKFKRSLLELYSQEKLLKEGKISDEDFTIVKLKIRLAMLTQSQKNTSQIISELENFTPKAMKIDHVLLSKIKAGKFSGEYRYTSYFLRDKDISALSPEELSKVRSLLFLEQRMILLNGAYFAIGRPYDIYTSLLDLPSRKGLENLAYHKAYMALDDKLTEKYCNFLDELQ